jgi:hypothetical protein
MDDPTRVVDLRVLGVQVEPPEVMLPDCTALDPRTPQDQRLRALLPYLQPVQYRALLADPAGAGRPLDWALFSCVSQGDRDCNEERLEMGRGQTPPGVLAPPPFQNGKLLGAEELLNGNVTDPAELLLLKVIAADTFRGLGGIRVPLVLDVKAGGEQVFAQKLMVYSCRRVEGMRANVNPVLPGLTLRGQAWEAASPPALQGPGPFRIEPLPFTAPDGTPLEEAYVVPSLAAEPLPIQLQEAWQISWHTDYGRMSREETGGADFANTVGRHQVDWVPPATGGQARAVRVWAVVRDGRGGQSWLERSFTWAP